jgi:hypothetical protein
MHSRAIVILSLFALACVIVMGSIAIRFTSASASGKSVSETAEGLQQATDESASALSTNPDLDDVDPASPNPSPDNVGFGRRGMAQVDLTPREIASADTLEILLGRVHRLFDPHDFSVSNEMIPYLAEMITVINQYDHLAYRVEIVDPDAVLAQQRAQTLNEVLRLNVLEPSKLEIVGRSGAHAALVDVYGI